MTQEMRKGAITFKGSPLTLIGKELKEGDKAPSFKLLSTELKEVTLDDFSGKTLIFSVVPSLDTEVCNVQSKRFNDEAKKLSPDVAVISISVDLPFAQGRWLTANMCSHIQTLSDYKERSFGKDYGVLIDELKLLSRAIFIVDKDKLSL